MKNKLILALPLAGIALVLASCGDKTTSETTTTGSNNNNTIVYSNETYYASPNGVASANGTKGSPVDIRTGFNKLKAGDTLILLDGTYNLPERILIDKTQNGASGHMITG